jgi:hypothetical protein
VWNVIQLSIFAREGDQPEPKPEHDRPQHLRVLITVKAAPNPSETYGETVCVAGLRLDPSHEGWVRLYPVNFRDLDDDRKFRKYDIVTVEAAPNRQDPRHESWRPRMDTLKVHEHLPPWQRRRQLLDPHTNQSMCMLLDAIRRKPPARSLGAIRPRTVDDLVIERHPGWTADEQRKIDKYVSQLQLFGADRSPLEAPRFRARFKYRCEASGCRGHAQGLLDWEFVALQRRLAGQDETSTIQLLRQKFLDVVCAPSRDVTFYVGNQAKRQHVFSVLGVFWPPT